MKSSENHKNHGFLGLSQLICKIQRMFRIKIVDLIEIHILCCVNFHLTGDSSPEKDRQNLEVVTGWSLYRTL